MTSGLKMYWVYPQHSTSWHCFRGYCTVIGSRHGFLPHNGILLLIVLGDMGYAMAYSWIYTFVFY